MSNNLDTTNNAAITFKDKLAFAEKLSSDINQFFSTAGDNEKKKVKEVLAAINSLKGVFHRQRVEDISKYIQEGKLKEAKDYMVRNYETVEFGDFEEILIVCLDNGNKLTHFINFAQNLLALTNERPAALKSIYQEMEIRERTKDVEILLLQKVITDLNTWDELREIRSKIEEDAQGVICKIVEEIIEDKFLFTKNFEETCWYAVLDEILPKVVTKYFEVFPDNSSQLLRYTYSLPTYNHEGIVLKSMFEVVKSQPLLDINHGMHLLAYCRFKNFEEMQYIVNELEYNKEIYFVTIKYFLQSQNHYELLSSTCNYLGSIFDDYVSWYLEEDSEEITNLIASLKHVQDLDVVSTFFAALYDWLETHEQMSTFQAFQLFTLAKRLNIEEAGQKFPNCINQLLWGNTTKCMIINKYYEEPLICDGADTTACCWVPGKTSDGQFWRITVDDLTSLLKIETHDGSLPLNCENAKKDSAVTPGNNWMIKAIDDDHIKIFKSKDEYLTTCGKFKSDPNKRQVVHLRSENSTDMQLWRLEFSA